MLGLLKDAHQRKNELRKKKVNTTHFEMRTMTRTSKMHTKQIRGTIKRQRQGKYNDGNIVIRKKEVTTSYEVLPVHEYNILTNNQDEETNCVITEMGGATKTDVNKIRQSR